MVVSSSTVKHGRQLGDGWSLASEKTSLVGVTLVFKFSHRFAHVGLESTVRTGDQRCGGPHFPFPLSRPLL